MRVGCCAPPPGTALARDRGGATLALLSFAMLIVSLDQYIVVVAFVRWVSGARLARLA